MEPVRKQIVYDEHQNPVHVLIAFEDWRKNETLLGKVERPNTAALMQFYGKTPFKGDAMDIQRKMRAEWPD